MWNLQALWLEIAVTDTKCDLCILHTFHPLSDTQLNSCGQKPGVSLPLWPHLPWLRFIRISLLKPLKVYLSLRGLALSWQARLTIVWGPGLLQERGSAGLLLLSSGSWGPEGGKGQWVRTMGDSEKKGLFFHPSSWFSDFRPCCFCRWIFKVHLSTHLRRGKPRKTSRGIKILERRKEGG